jgi:MFS family permease
MADALSKDFYLLWFGQFISAFGSALTSFAIGIWIYERTQSSLALVNMMLCATLPTLLLLPWAGSVADRVNKQRVLIGSDLLAISAVGVIAYLLAQQQLQVPMLYGMQILVALALAFQAPAGQAAMVHMVPKSQFGRAGGMFAISQAVSVMAGPLLASSLLKIMPMQQILYLDLASFAVSILCLLLARFPVIQNEVGWSFWRQPWRDLGAAFGFFFKFPSMALIYAYLALGGFLAGMVTVLVTPLVLSMSTVDVLANISASAALGVFLGGLGMAIWGGPKRWHSGILSLSMLEGLAVALAGYFTQAWALCLLALLVMLSNSLLQGSVLAVWRRKVPLVQQGSVAALQRAIDLSLMALSGWLGGLLADWWLEPAMRAGGSLAGSVGLWFGVGPGRGIGLLFVGVGTLVVLMSLAALGSRRLQQLETDVPDAF